MTNAACNLLPNPVAFPSTPSRNSSAGSPCPLPQKHFLTALHAIPSFNCCISGLPGPSTARSDCQGLCLEAPLRPLGLPADSMGPVTPSQLFPACASDSPSNPPLSVSLQRYTEAVACAWNALTPLTNSLRFWYSDSF